MSRTAPLRRAAVLTAAVGTLVLALLGTAVPTVQAEASAPALTTPFQLVQDRPVDDRLPTPEDRYALAGGCYTARTADGRWLARVGDAITTVLDDEQALPLHFQPLRLGEYLLATDEGPDTSVEGAWWDVRGYVSRPSGVQALTGALIASDTAVVADAPSVGGEWAVTEAADQTRPGGGQGEGNGVPTLYDVTATDGSAALGTFTFHVIRPGTPGHEACAIWPEIDVDAEGRPAPNPDGPAAEVQGFFESHVHGMAYEFLGGEARCGQPWHPYGVEFALAGCELAGPGGRALVLETVLSGRDPIAGHDPVGWPTFADWPAHDSLTYEQYYWRWLERAWLGGLRLSVNLLVDNTALCELYPLKRNSCNEMDGVRLQAQRLFELQDYIDAQSGGPGEGWLRIVTDPTQAREVINAGRLAVVMGIEVSVLFDCGEVLDVPQCTEADIDARLQEVYDMGVRQMELINKFDNALSGVTGDGGTTGAVVNTGNRYVTGHFWDMQACEPEGHAHEHGFTEAEHDKRQPNLVDDGASQFPGGAPDEVDVLAGAVIQALSPTRGAGAPLYGPGPHCNSRGLTDLGRHLIEQMVAKGMIFDPDHMSAAGQRQALDHIEDVIIPAEQAAAHAEGRPARQPAVISSHSWGNDVTYQRIYQLDGMIGSRTDRADGFVDDWAQRRAWAEAHAPEGSLFGLGYGADTNGFGAQPGPRSSPAVPIDYATGWEAPIGGVRLFQQSSGVRTFDITTEGVAHYGLFADWFREVALAADERHAGLGGGEAIIRDMLNGSEAYLRLWERNVVGGGDCVADQSGVHTQDVHALLGGNAEGFLAAIGQPVSRDGAAWTYCATGLDGRPTAVEVVFDATGTAVSATESIAAAEELLQPVAGVVHDGHGH